MLQLVTVGLTGSFAGGCVWACDSALNPMTADAKATAVLVTSAVRSFMRAPWFLTAYTFARKSNTAWSSRIRSNLAAMSIHRIIVKSRFFVFESE